MPAFTSAVHPSRARRQAAYTIACLILVALAAVTFMGPATGNARAATPPQPPSSVTTHPVLKAPSIGSVGFDQAQFSGSAPLTLTLSGLSDPGVAVNTYSNFKAWGQSGRHENATLSLVEPSGASARTYYLTASIPTKINIIGADPSQMSVTIACESISTSPPPTAPGQVFPAPTTLTIHATTYVTSGESFPVLAVVTAQGRPVVPTGTVQLSVDGNPQGSPVPVHRAGTSTNQARTTLMATIQAPGVHAITATYTSTNGQTLRSTSNPISILVISTSSVPPGSS